MNFSIGEFTKLHTSIQSIIASIIIFYPFWFINIFLFHKTFYIANPIYITLVFTLCFTIAWAYVMLMFSSVIKILELKMAGKKKADKSEQTEIIGLAIYFGIPILLFFDWVAYDEKRNINFVKLLETLMVITVATLGGIIIAALGSNYFDKRSNKKNQPELEFPKEEEK